MEIRRAQHGARNTPETRWPVQSPSPGSASPTPRVPERIRGRPGQRRQEGGGRCQPAFRMYPKRLRQPDPSPRSSGRPSAARLRPHQRPHGTETAGGRIMRPAPILDETQDNANSRRGQDGYAAIGPSVPPTALTAHTPSSVPLRLTAPPRRAPDVTSCHVSPVARTNHDTTREPNSAHSTKAWSQSNTRTGPDSNRWPPTDSCRLACQTP